MYRPPCVRHVVFIPNRNTLENRPYPYRSGSDQANQPWENPDCRRLKRIETWGIMYSYSLCPEWIKNLETPRYIRRPHRVQNCQFISISDSVSWVGKILDSGVEAQKKYIANMSPKVENIDSGMNRKNLSYLYKKASFHLHRSMFSVLDKG